MSDAPPSTHADVGLPEVVSPAEWRASFAFTFLDLTPLGRQENWEDSPPGRPQGEPYQWWRRHDECGRS
jgi:predicted dithiol-disulfide oxidoreductase (DUF899 family)